MIVVSDRGMVTKAKLERLSETDGVGWITALKAPQVKQLQLQLSLFDQQNLAEIEAERAVASFEAGASTRETISASASWRSREGELSSSRASSKPARHRERRLDVARRQRALETHYGPTLKTRERLTAEGPWEDCRGEILAMAERRNEATDGSLLMHAEYLVTVGRKAGGSA